MGCFPSRCIILLTGLIGLVLMSCGRTEYGVFSAGPEGLLSLKVPTAPADRDWFDVRGGSWISVAPRVAVRNGGQGFTSPPQDVRDILNFNLPRPLSSRALTLWDSHSGRLYVKGGRDDVVAVRTFLEFLREEAWTDRQVSVRVWRVPSAELVAAKTQAGSDPAKLEQALRVTPTAIHLAEIITRLSLTDTPASAGGRIERQSQVKWPGGSASLLATVPPGSQTHPVTANWRFEIPASSSVAEGSAVVADGKTHGVETADSSGMVMAVFASWSRATNWEIQPQEPPFLVAQRAWQEHAPRIQIDTRPDRWLVKQVHFHPGDLHMLEAIQSPELVSAFGTGDYYDLRPLFEAQGVSFPPGSLAILDADRRQLLIRQNESQMDLMEAYTMSVGVSQSFQPQLRWVCTTRKGNAEPRALTRVSVLPLLGSILTSSLSSAAGAKVDLETELTATPEGRYFGRYEISAELPSQDAGGAITLKMDAAATMADGQQLDYPVAVLGNGPEAVTVNARWQIPFTVEEPQASQGELDAVLEKVAAKIWKL